MKDRFETILNDLFTWPVMSHFQQLVIVAALASFFVSCLALRRSFAAGRDLLARVVEEAAEEIRWRLTKAPSIDVDTASSVCRMVEARVHSPVVTEPMVLEAIRIASRSRNISISNPTMVGFRSIELFSVANKNRMYAFAASALSSSLLVLAVAFQSMKDHSWVALCLVLAQLALAVLVVRAGNFWTMAEATLRSGHPGACVADAPKWWSNFFAWVAASNNFGVVHTLWGPAWETVAFGVIPAFTIPLFVGMALVVGGRWLGVSQKQIAGTASTAAQWLTLLQFAIGMGLFRYLHIYKVIEVRALRGKLSAVIRKERVEAFRSASTLTARVLDPVTVSAYEATCLRLWQITGNEEFQDWRVRLRDDLAQVAAPHWGETRSGRSKT